MLLTNCAGISAILLSCVPGIEGRLDFTGESMSSGPSWSSAPLSASSFAPFIPRRIWQVGQSLTNRDINSFGTLGGQCEVLQRPTELTRSIPSSLVPMSCPYHHAGISDGLESGS